MLCKAVVQLLTSAVIKTVWPRPWRGAPTPSSLPPAPLVSHLLPADRTPSVQDSQRVSHPFLISFIQPSGLDRWEIMRVSSPPSKRQSKHFHHLLSRRCPRQGWDKTLTWASYGFCSDSWSVTYFGCRSPPVETSNLCIPTATGQLCVSKGNNVGH